MAAKRPCAISFAHVGVTARGTARARTARRRTLLRNCLQGARALVAIASTAATTGGRVCRGSAIVSLVGSFCRFGQGLGWMLSWLASAVDAMLLLSQAITLSVSPNREVLKAITIHALCHALPQISRP